MKDCVTVAKEIRTERCHGKYGCADGARGSVEDRRRCHTFFVWEARDREAIRAAIQITTHERNRTQVLLLSFTTVSGYEAVEIFNQRSYEGHDDWELRASGVKFHGGDNSDLMTIQEAVDLASLLRRKDYVAQNDA